MTKEEKKELRRKKSREYYRRLTQDEGWAQFGVLVPRELLPKMREYRKQLIIEWKYKKLVENKKI